MKLQWISLALLCLSSFGGYATITGTEYDSFGTDDVIAGKSVDEDQANPGRKMITPAAGTKIKTGADAFIIAEFLEWEARQNGLVFAQTGIGATATSTPSQGSSYTPNFQFNPGFRVALGLGLDHDDWDVIATYTWYQQNSNENSVTNSNTTTNSLIPGMNFPYTLPSSLTYASGNWNLRLSCVDMNLGRNFFISHYLSIRPMIGLKAAWQNQTYDASYIGTVRRVQTQNTIHQSEKAFGIGMVGGMKMLWSFTRNWGIYANAFGDILSTRFKLNSKNKQFAVNNNSNITVDDQLSSKISVLQPIVELSLGICWDNWFDDDQYHLGIRLGWEEQMWFNNNHFIISNNNANRGDLSMQGLVFSLRFDF
jgi:hypothetical protein